MFAQISRISRTSLLKCSCLCLYISQETRPASKRSQTIGHSHTHRHKHPKRMSIRKIIDSACLCRSIQPSAHCNNPIYTIICSHMGIYTYILTFPNKLIIMNLFNDRTLSCIPWNSSMYVHSTTQWSVYLHRRVFHPGVLGGKSGAWVVFRCCSVFAEETYTLVSLLQAVCTTRIVSRVREYLFECPEETGGIFGKLKIERRARTWGTLGIEFIVVISGLRVKYEYCFWVKAFAVIGWIVIFHVKTDKSGPSDHYEQGLKMQLKKKKLE